VRGSGEHRLLGGSLSPALEHGVGHWRGRAPGSHLVGGAPRCRLSIRAEPRRCAVSSRSASRRR